MAEAAARAVGRAKRLAAMTLPKDPQDAKSTDEIMTYCVIIRGGCRHSSVRELIR